MVHHADTTLDAAEVIARAKRFFADRVPHQAAYPEAEGPGYLTLRGQGGEEIALAAWRENGTTRVRASTLLFDQPVGRFLALLPPPPSTAA